MPHVLMKDKLGSYGAARQEIALGLEQPGAQWLEQPCRGFVSSYATTGKDHGPL
ncbi:hypothetical protein PsAD46_01197 [Pseudovibrio sp. Ad46]|nr:hypothetical protein PsAD46_01197 [Pseudovibrio sp. Ad46]KZL00160.1 hypothetical protein PsAD5_01206 [Pseudovibrio sp. Ad5]